MCLSSTKEKKIMLHVNRTFSQCGISTCGNKTRHIRSSHVNSQPDRQGICSVSSNHRYVTYHVHIIATFHIKSWRGWRCCYNKPTMLPNGTSLDIFLRAPGDISRHFCGNLNQLSFTGSRTIFIRACGEQNRWFFFFFAKTMMFS